MKTRIEYTSALLRERYVRMEHESGLAIYLFPKQMRTGFAYFATRYGSIDCAPLTDRDGVIREIPDGVAHFLEHKLFDNEDGVDSFVRFAACGADANAYTSHDRTAYLFSSTERFGEALEELLQFVTHPYFTEASVQKEQGIIAEEIRMYEDHPWDRCYQNLLEALYWEHPVRKNICGTEASIARITPELLYACHKAYYSPQNMVLVICGDVDEQAIVAAVDRIIGVESVETALPPRRFSEPREVRTSRVSASMTVAKPLFSIGIKDCVEGLDPEALLRRDLAMTLLDEILFSRAGRFYNRLFESGQISPSFSAGYSCGEGFGYHCISGESDDPERVLEELRQYIAQVKAEGIDAEDFERCRRVLYADEIRAYDSTEEIATRLLTFALDGVDLFSCPTVLQEITPEEVERLLHESLREDAMVLSVILPGDARAQENERMGEEQ